MHFPSSCSTSSGSASPSLSLQTGTADDSLSTLGEQHRSGNGQRGDATAPLNLQIFVPELQMQKCLSVAPDELVWDIKRRLFDALPQQLPQPFNFGLFLPPCDGRAGKFLLEDRPIRDYPFHDCVPYVELKYKKRVYKMLRLDEKALKAVHSKQNLRKLNDAIQARNAAKVERLCAQGIDPNFHDAHGETPLTLAAGAGASREVLVQLVGGGAHLDFRNTEGQTAMHKAAFLSLADNVRALLELGASPNYRDMIGLTPLYYNMLSTESSAEVAEMLLAEAAELDVVDMHGNTALHQACKNGLSKHVEQLLYYGADINARNVNGNTPLHVCAVNGRVDCAQVLLFRGADPSLANRQGQPAAQVAHIVNALAVAEVIQGHSPHNVVPFRDAPKLNPRRRVSSRQLGSVDPQQQHMRRRSLSHCSSTSTMASSVQQQRFPAQQHRASPNPSVASSSALGGAASSDYGTLRRIPADAVQRQQPGFEPNMPRILVIPRGPKGFGFILRGARHTDSMPLDFCASPAHPALQFFEGVDMSGMAMRAGLRPGDFLLEINGVDVRAASHERVVELIHGSGDTITLKVITVELPQQNGAQQIYAQTGHYASGGTMGRRKNHHSVPPTPPPPPQRNPSTTLSFGRAFGNSGQAAQFSASDLPPPPHRCADQNPSPVVADPPTPIRCASVKLGRPSAVRRISAAELEHLMVQQGPSPGEPKKFTSVTEMKRRKQVRTNGSTVSNGAAGEQPLLMKSSSSSPDLHGEYAAANRLVLRPKTPPPPPPPGTATSQRATMPTSIPATAPFPPADAAQPQPIYASTVVVVPPPAVNGAPPAPPPPPPLNLLKAMAPSNKTTTQQNGAGTGGGPSAARPPPSIGTAADCRGISAEALLAVRLKPVNARSNSSEGATAEQKVQPAAPKEPNNAQNGPSPKVPTDFDSDLRSALARRRSKVQGADSQEEPKQEQQRQNGVTVVNRYNAGLSLRESVLENVVAGKAGAALNGGTGPNSKSRGGAAAGGAAAHSPPGGGCSFIGGAKKDSGYTSSRTSLEPSECGDCEQQHSGGASSGNGTGQSLPVQHRVNVLSQQMSLEPPPQCAWHRYPTQAASAQKQSQLQRPLFPVPPVDYDEEGDEEGQQPSTSSGGAKSLDSGQGGSSGSEDRVSTNSAEGVVSCASSSSPIPAQPVPSRPAVSDQFRQKPVEEWGSADVLSWLGSLSLDSCGGSVYAEAFANVCGADLLRFDRTRFTALGVTRIAHRQAMERSLGTFTRRE